MKNQKLSRAIEHDLKVAIRDGQREIKEGFRTGKEPNWKAIEADMKSQLDLNPNTYKKHVDYADKRHISHCKRASVNPEVDSHNYDKYESFYKRDAGKYVVKNNIDRMKSLWKKTKRKTSSERVSYYQKVKGVWDRRNRRSSKFITSRITENASRENNAKTTGFVDLLNLGPKPCLECIALRGIHNAETAPKLPIHDHCYCEFRPGAVFASKADEEDDWLKDIMAQGEKRAGKATVVKPKEIKKPSAKKLPLKKSKLKPEKPRAAVKKEERVPVAVPIKKGEDRFGEMKFKIDSNSELNKEENQVIKALQSRLSPKFEKKGRLHKDLGGKNFITFVNNDAEAGAAMGTKWKRGVAGITVKYSTDTPQIIQINKYRKQGSSIHEIGHVVEGNMNYETKAEVKSCWAAKAYSKGKQQGGIVSSYSLTNEQEFFCENFKTYVQNPKKLMKIDPKMYNIIKTEVFNNVEWT